MPHWEINVRRRPRVDEEPANVHAALMSCLESLPIPWKLVSPIKFSSKVGWLSTTISLRGKLGKGLSGYVTYSLRSTEYLQDSAQYDDLLVIEFDPKKVELAALPEVVIPAIVKSFNAYRASVGDIELLSDDWPKIVELTERSGRDADGRHGVFRFSPIGYYERDLVFGETRKTPEQLAQAIPDLVTCLGSGVLINALRVVDETNLFHDIDRIIREGRNG